MTKTNNTITLKIPTINDTLNAAGAPMAYELLPMRLDLQQLRFIAANFTQSHFLSREWVRGVNFDTNHHRLIATDGHILLLMRTDPWQVCGSPKTVDRDAIRATSKQADPLAALQLNDFMLNDHELDRKPPVDQWRNILAAEVTIGFTHDYMCVIPTVFSMEGGAVFSNDYLAKIEKLKRKFKIARSVERYGGPRDSMRVDLFDARDDFVGIVVLAPMRI